VNDRHARFGALLPPGVRSRRDPDPFRAKPRRSVLSWACDSPLEFAPSTVPGSVSRVEHSWPGLIPRLECSPEAQPSRVVRETRAPTPGVMIPRDPPAVRSYRSPRPPSGSGPAARVRIASARTASHLLHLALAKQSSSPAPPLGGAPRLPRPSSRVAREGYTRRDLGDASFVRSVLVGPPVARCADSSGVPSLVERTRRSRLATPLAYTPFDLAAYRCFTRGSTLRRRNASRPRSRRRLPSWVQ